MTSPDPNGWHALAKIIVSEFKKELSDMRSDIKEVVSGQATVLERFGAVEGRFAVHEEREKSFADRTLKLEDGLKITAADTQDLKNAHKNKTLLVGGIAAVLVTLAALLAKLVIG